MIGCRAARVVLLAALAAACAYVPATAATSTSDGDDSVGFAASPLRHDVAVTPGKVTTHDVEITNTDTVATTYTFSKVDIRGDAEQPEATPVLLGGKVDSAISGYDWLDVPSQVTIQPGQSRDVVVRVTPPDGATGGHYAAMIVEGASRGAGRITTTSRIAVVFLMNAGGVPPPDLRITEVREVGPNTTVTEYVNTGQTDTTPTGVIETQDPITNTVVSETEGECTTALPGGSGTCTFEETPGDTVADSPSGLEKRYIEVGDPRSDGTLARDEMPVEWAGTWSSMLLPLVGIALFVLYFLFLRRRRKDEADEDVVLDQSW